ncbi:MAG TPA: exodeoxyribonuclease VII large subunit [Methanocorpusculum sp.]|nr:exodeoxyribonuclease VII large subunit [Methanocorpusculum sp.]
MVRKSAGTRQREQQSTLSFDERTEDSGITLITPVDSLGKKTSRSSDPVVLTVSEANVRIQGVLSTERLTNISVTGEVTGFRPNASGHVYFSLTEKSDEGDASLSCVLWKFQAAKYLTFPFHNGIAVTVTGNVDYYSPSGKLQFVVKKIEPALAGKAGLFLKKEEWKRELEAAGVIPRPESEMRDLPLFPKCIGVVTSKTGSVLQDIRNVLSRRYPLPVLLAPAQVQGDGAETSIVAAIAALQGKVDLIILARGGGSFEDLFVFNHPDVVRAVRYSQTPVITAIGHETDTTLVDYAGDRRSPTPSAAAETAVLNRDTLKSNLGEYRVRIIARTRAIIAENRSVVAELRFRVNPSRLSRRLDMMHQQTADLADRLHDALVRRIVRERDQLWHLCDMTVKRAGRKVATAKLELTGIRDHIASCDPQKALDRGYAMVTVNGTMVRSCTQVAEGDRIGIRLADGSVTAKVEKIQ